ncbi:MAG: ABC transporter permease [Candidatus Rokuibacteriota bacterium]|nr:MAG: ABC transporter permease [Candidatus Rokubacteria bacterium]
MAPGFWRRYRANRAALLGLALFATVAGTAIGGPLLHRGDPWALVTRPFLWPGDRPGFPLGSDAMGRDVLAGVIHGAHVSLMIGLTATAAALGIGVAIGALAGYFRGWADDALMRLTEVFQTIPNFLFVIVLVTIFKPSIRTIVVAIGIVSWPPIARLVRAEFLTLREREFVQACIAVGMSEGRIIARQILPNCLPPVIVLASIMVATAILVEAGLAFLGLGDPNVMSWGKMIGEGRGALRSAWYLSAIPGVAILVTVLALNLVGEGLNDALNPRLTK